SPFSGSTLKPPQTFTPAPVFQKSAFPQLSYPYSPGCGMVWKIHTRSPVYTLKALTFAGEAHVMAPTITRSPTVTGAPGAVIPIFSGGFTKPSFNEIRP